MNEKLGYILFSHPIVILQHFARIDQPTTTNLQQMLQQPGKNGMGH